MFGQIFGPVLMALLISDFVHMKTDGGNINLIKNEIKNNYLYQEPQPTEEKETESVIDKLDDCVKTFFSQADELIKNLKK